VFTDEELERLRRFPDINREELIRHFTLTPADEAFVHSHRGAGNVLGVTVQLCTLPWLEFVPDHVAAVPGAAAARDGGQLVHPRILLHLLVHRSHSSVAAGHRDRARVRMLRAERPPANREEGGCPIPVMMVRAKIKADSIDEIEAQGRKLFSEIEEIDPRSRVRGSRTGSVPRSRARTKPGSAEESGLGRQP